MTENKAGKKEKVLRWTHGIGKLLFIILVFVQAIALARYPSIYWKNEWGNIMLIVMLPSLIVWYQHKKKTHEQQIDQLWKVWLAYVIPLTVMISVIFGGLRSKLDKTHFFGPNILRMTMCITPGIALLLFITTSKARKHYSELVVELCGNVAVDLFDYVEVLTALLPQSGSVYLSDAIAGTTIALVLVSLLLSVLEISENKLQEGKIEKNEKLYLWRLILKIPVNLTLLIIRLVVWLKLKHDASIFIAKNMIIILIMIYNIVLYFLDKKENKKGRVESNTGHGQFHQTESLGNGTAKSKSQDYYSQEHCLIK
ncbi:uncharacterized protein LOC116295284 [Actinia tenebrosa]|uniref:Uncharacterized protein LOC116295284 n=1 Tax=Actinia tenebrosa TaxID=6105 RepID=A0A6P8I243_ACTTE|nr:uncharacterized protein LOC116295284 [Actinia tenebrosa]